MLERNKNFLYLIAYMFFMLFIYIPGQYLLGLVFYKHLLHNNFLLLYPSLTEDQLRISCIIIIMTVCNIAIPLIMLGILRKETHLLEKEKNND